MKKLEKGAKKVYTTTPTKCKDGRTTPITRVHIEKPCPVCLSPMLIEIHKKGTLKTRAWKRWRCTDSNCNHYEISEGEVDRKIRLGLTDQQNGILKHYTE